MDTKNIKKKDTSSGVQCLIDLMAGIMPCIILQLFIFVLRYGCAYPICTIRSLIYSSVEIRTQTCFYVQSVPRFSLTA